MIHVHIHFEDIKEFDVRYFVAFENVLWTETEFWVADTSTKILPDIVTRCTSLRSTWPFWLELEYRDIELITFDYIILHLIPI